MHIAFERYPEVLAGISERSDGSMVWWNRLPVDDSIQRNRDRYFKSLGIVPSRVAAGGIAHGINVVAAGEKQVGAYLLSTDGLTTNVPNVFLTITAADCMSIFLCDPVTESVGIAHVGWRGLVKGMLEAIVQKFKDAYGSESKNLLVTIGPHIRACHYEVGSKVAVQFNQQSIQRRGEKFFASLADEAKRRLGALGVTQVLHESICTYESANLFYSARRDKVEPLQGMVAYIGLKR